MPWSPARKFPRVRPKPTSRAPHVTDAEGRFRFPYLRLGPYEIIVRSQGFSDATRRLNLTVGSAFDLPIALKLEAVAESVTVTGTATVLESARSQIAGTVSQAEVGQPAAQRA